MNVSLTPELEALVRQKVQAGLYNNASEVMREALQLLEERDRLKRLKTLSLLVSLMQTGAKSPS